MKSPWIPSRRLLLMKLKRTSLYTWSPTTFDMDITIQNQFAFQPIYYVPIHYLSTARSKWARKTKNCQTFHTFQPFSRPAEPLLRTPRCEPQWLRRLNPADHLPCDPSCKAALRTRRRRDRSRKPPSWPSWILEIQLRIFCLDYQWLIRG